MWMCLLMKSVQHMLVATTNDMSAEGDDEEEESRDFKRVEDKGLKDSKEDDFEIIEDMKDSNKEAVHVSEHSLCQL
jgi:hypothetical protein